MSQGPTAGKAKPGITCVWKDLWERRRAHQPYPCNAQSSAQQAPPSPAMGCHNVLDVMDGACLRAAEHQPHTRSAPGMDQVTAQQDAEHVDEHRRALHARRRANRYVAPPVARVWIEQEEGTKRPRGTPCVAAQRVHRAVVRILEARCEPDWHALSHGVRQGHRQHQALHELREQCRKLHSTWRGEADVRGCVDPLDGGHVRAGMQQRVQEGGIVRLSGTWLHAGVLEAGVRSDPDQGTPHGGVCSSPTKLQTFFSGSLSLGYGSIRNTILTSSCV